MAKKEPQELSPQAVDRITRVVRSLGDDHVERGVDLSRPVHCDSCGLEKPPQGAAIFGSYKLCNDCLLDFTLQLASGRADNVADFMTKRDDRPVSDLESHRDPRSVPLQSFPGRVVPSNEPL